MYLVSHRQTTKNITADIVHNCKKIRRMLKNVSIISLLRYWGDRQPPKSQCQTLLYLLGKTTDLTRNFQGGGCKDTAHKLPLLHIQNAGASSFCTSGNSRDNLGIEGCGIFDKHVLQRERERTSLKSSVQCRLGCL